MSHKKKTIALIPLLAIISFLLSCNKSGDSTDPITHINCDGLITDTLGTNDNGRVYMPNAFTPNGDGVNEIIRPVPFNILSMIFTIYDENNNVVFTTNQLLQGWQPATAGNVSLKYYYKIQATTVSNHKIGICGELYRLTCIPINISLSSLHFEDQLTPNGFTGVTIELLPTCH